MKKYILILSSLFLILAFQNCGGEFQTADFSSTNPLSINNNSMPIETIRSPFANSKVSIKTSISQKNSFSLNSVAVKDDIVEPSLALAILIDNACAINSNLNTQLNVFSNAISVNFSRLNKRLKMQSYDASVRMPMKLSEIKVVLDKEPCVIGISNNGTTQIAVDLSPSIETSQDHHRAIHTLDGYRNFFSQQLSQNQNDIVVAVIDTGVDITHPFLKNVLWQSPDNEKIIDLTMDRNGLDGNGHGTHVAGLIAAQYNSGNNTVGVAASGVKIMAVKALNADGAGSISDVANAILYAIDNGAEVINMSLGGGFNFTDDLYMEAFRQAANKNIPIFVAAGNSNSRLYPFNLFPPADMTSVPGVISVGSVNSSDLSKSGFSNFGDLIDISAPGSYDYSKKSCVLSTFPILPSKLGDAYRTTLGYGKICGTSMATPIVTGAAALLIRALKYKSINFTSDTIESLLKKTAQIGNAPTLGSNLVLDLGRLGLYLSNLNQLPAEYSTFNSQDPYVRYISGLFMNILYRKYDDEGMRFYLDKMKNHTSTIASLNADFINSSEFVDSTIFFGTPETRSVGRLFTNIIGRGPTQEELSILNSDQVIKNTNDLIANLLVRPEALSILQNLKIEAFPVFESDKKFSTSEIINRNRKRVAAFSYFVKNFSRQPKMTDIQIVEPYLGFTTGKEIIDNAYKNEPVDLKAFIISQYKAILDRTETEITNSEIEYYRQKLMDGSLSKVDFVNTLNTSPEKRIRNIFKEYTTAIPFLWQVSNFVNDLVSGNKTLEVLRNEIKVSVSNMNSSFIVGKIEELLGKYLLRTTDLTATAPFKVNTNETNFWSTRFNQLNNWNSLEAEMAATKEAVIYKLYMTVVGRSAYEIRYDYAPVLVTINLFASGKSESEVRNLLENSDETFIRRLYATYFYRSPLMPELYRYLDGLNNGTYSRASITAYFEGKTKAPDLSINEISNSDFLITSYTQILGRNEQEIANDSAGFNYWLQALNSQQVSRSEVEAAFKTSIEYYLRQIYQTELHRRADWEGLVYWITEISSGRTTIEQVRLSFRQLCTNHVSGECSQ